MIVRQGFGFGSVQEIFNPFYGSIINDGNEFFALKLQFKVKEQRNCRYILEIIA